MNGFHRPLAQALESYQGLGRFRFHVPGHSGNALVESLTGWTIPGLSPETYRFDQTEVEGLDVLSEPEGCLLASQHLVAEGYGVAHSFYSVNGASALLIAGMLSMIKPGEKVLLPRNVHRAVISGLILTGAKPIWLMPPWDPVWGIWGSLSADAIRKHLEQDSEIKALVVTSPTYEGIGSDIPALSAICKEHQVKLLVDEAHGSLWPFCEALPQSALYQGADLVIQSLHKSAGSLTQTALGHLPKGSCIDPEVFQDALNTLQTTSPSYLLMASLEAAALMLTMPETREQLRGFLEQVQGFRKDFSAAIKAFELFQPSGSSEMFHSWDPTRLLIRHPSWAGQDWAVQMESENGLAYESTSPDHSLYIAQWGLEPSDYKGFLSVFDQAQTPVPQSNFKQSNFKQSKFKKSKFKKSKFKKSNFKEYPPLPIPITGLLPRDAFFAPSQPVSQSEAVGRIAKNTLVHCPPGVPVLLPGEVIQEAHGPYLPEQVLVIIEK
jgi:arginine decarboxylase